jgi:hypothetical protein
VDDLVIDPVDVDADDGNDDVDEWAAEQMMRPDIRFFRDGRTLETPDDSIPQFTDRAEHENGGARLNAMSYFLRFFNEQIITTFVFATNAHADSSRYARWVNLSQPEFMTFVAICLWFGINRLPEQAMAWSSTNLIFGSVFIQRLMSKSRFRSIMACWHWDNHYDMPAQERQRRNSENCFWAVQSFLDILRGNCLQNYRPNQELCIDEQSIATKCRHRAKCYNPAKPDKWHFKNFCLNDSGSAYVVSFFLYQGRDEVRPAGVPATEYPVRRLLEHERWSNKGYILFIDNWYNSVSLGRWLLSRGINFVGTLRVNRSGIPREQLFPKTGRQVRNRGEMAMFRKEFPEGVLRVVCWQDTKPVHLLTSLKSKVGFVERNAYNGGLHAINRVTAPSMITYYNSHMGGTDKMDQQLSYYRIKMKTKRWPIKIFLHFLSVAVMNAHVLYRADLPDSAAAPANKQQGYFLLGFIQLLIKELIPVNVFARATAPFTSPAPAQGTEPVRGIVHTPFAKYSGRNPDNRRRCAQCHTKTIWTCRECDVTLCLNEVGGDNCWQSYHFSV